MPPITSNRILPLPKYLELLRDILLNGELLEVEKNVQWARRLHEGYAQILLEDREFCALLASYSTEIERSRALMEELGLPGLCSYCATKIQGGGCCGSHIATWYDPIVLLLNLLMSVEIPEKSYYEDSCRFLGRDGCSLKARYHFCVNYLCTRIYQHLHENALTRLKSQSGRELFLSWQLELFLMDFFSKRGANFTGPDIPL